MTIWNAKREFYRFFRPRIGAITPSLTGTYVVNRFHKVSPLTPLGLEKRKSEGSAKKLENVNTLQLHAPGHVVPIVLFAVLMVILVGIWLIYRTKASERRHSFAQIKRPKSDRGSVARFYEERRYLNQGSSLRSSNTMDGTEKSSVLNKRIQKAEYSCGTWNHQNGPRVQVAMRAPSVPIGQPQTVQPYGKLEFPKRVLTESYGLEQAAVKESGLSKTNTGSLKLSGAKSLISRARSNSEDKRIQLLRRQSFTQSSVKDSFLCVPSRKYSVRPDRFSMTQHLRLPVRQVLTSTLRRSLGGDDDDWINVGLSLYGRGRIGFSLSYVCTTGLLGVTINRLAGVHQLEAVDSQLPSQSQTYFMVGLRLENSQHPTLVAKGPSFETTQFTHSKLASLNPIFDQSFSFRLQSKDIDSAELVFSIHKTVSQSFSPLDVIERHRRQSAVSLTTAERRRLPVEFHQKAETQCLGVVRYKLNRHDLINRPEVLKELWRDIERITEFDETSSEETNGTSPFQAATINTADLSQLSGVSKEHIFKWSEASTQTKPTVELSIYYDLGKSHLFIRLEDARNIRLRRKDAYIFARTVLYKGDKVFASARGPSNKLTKTNVPSSRTEHGTQSDKQFPTDLFQFPIDVVRILDGTTLGVTVYLCTRSRLGLSHLVGQCSVGASGFVGGKGNVHWEQLLQAIRATQNAGSLAPTPICKHWHELSQAFH
ncbi:unnamed protein product [Dicrocoelium dendriticum]|nr:unnamed protein product [Dicrocoelium dendriticum]